jgi:cyanate permease
VGLAFAENTPAIFMSIVLFGATVGNILMLQPLLIAERFGVLDYPRIYSRAQLFGLVGTAGGPLLLGWLHDASGGYRSSYIAAALCSVAGAAVFVMSGPAERDDAAVRESVGRDTVAGA